MRAAACRFLLVLDAELLERYRRAVLPQVLQIVELACLRHEYVQHSAAVVEPHPLRGLIALGVVDHDVVVILEMPLYVVCQRLDLRGRGRGADTARGTG